jgi:hypothetical protein
VLKNVFRTSQKIDCFSIVWTNQIVLFSEAMAVYSHKDRKPIVYKLTRFIILNCVIMQYPPCLTWLHGRIRIYSSVSVVLPKIWRTCILSLAVTKAHHFSSPSKPALEPTEPTVGSYRKEKTAEAWIWQIMHFKPVPRLNMLEVWIHSSVCISAMILTCHRKILLLNFP